MPNLHENGPVVLEEIIVQGVNVFSLFEKRFDPLIIRSIFYFVPTSVEIGPVVLKKMIFKSCQYTVAMLLECIIFSEKSSTLRLNIINSLYTKCFVQNLV